MSDTTVALDGLVFPEGPRWHEGRLWFSDQHDHRVVALHPASGDAETVVEVAGQPSGLGWLPDGRLLVVSMVDRRVVRLDADGPVEHADLSALAPHRCNDMVVDGDGLAYVGNFGFDIFTDDLRPRPTCLVRVDPDGSARVVADDLGFPNGMVVTPDGRTLVVAESMGARLTAFDVAGDGSLSGRRAFASLPGTAPDGICLDAHGACWVADPIGGAVLHVDASGSVVDRLAPDQPAFACALGGTDGTTLFLCTAPTSDPGDATAARGGRIETIEVAVPAAPPPAPRS